MAHTGSSAGGFVGGFAHPLFGPDHVVAMVAVGLWGAFLGAPAIWLFSDRLPLVMAFGGVIGNSRGPPARGRNRHRVIRVVLGTMVALGSGPVVGAAHARRRLRDFPLAMPMAQSSARSGIVAYSVGLRWSQPGLLSSPTGIAVGLLARWRAGRIAVRTAGGCDRAGRRGLPVAGFG
jgi:urease accessory protein